MTDFVVLRDTINNSRLEPRYIARQLNISSQAFLNKINGKLDFKVSEVRTLASLLELNSLQMKAIFFTHTGDFKSK
jgi:hypothetical protein